MKKTLLTIICATGCLAALWSCIKDVEVALPASLNDNGGVTTEVGEGTVTLKWKPVTDKALEYIEVRYTVASKPYVLTAEKTDTQIVVENLLRSYGVIEFTVQPFNSSKKGGAETVVSAQCLAVPKQITLNGETSFVYPSAATAYTDSPEALEGPIADLFDGNNATYFHSNYSDDPKPMPHYIVVDLERDAYAFSLRYTTRDHQTPADNNPSEIRLLVSNTFDSATFDTSVCTEAAHITEGLPTEAVKNFVSETLLQKSPFRYVWFEVDATLSGTAFFSLAEMTIVQAHVDIYDPETGETVNEKPIPDPTFTFTVNPTPADATVKLNNTVQKSITVKVGSIVDWEVSAKGYTPKSGRYTVNSNYTLDVTLDAESAKYVKVEISDDQVFADNVQAGDGAKEYLTDGIISADSYYHGIWSGATPLPHYIVIKLSEPLKDFKFAYANRVRGKIDADINVKAMNVYIGTDTFDGTTYTVEGLTKILELDKLPNVDNADCTMTYVSNVLEPATEFNTIYFEVTETWGSCEFFSWAELELYRPVFGGVSGGEIGYEEFDEE